MRTVSRLQADLLLLLTAAIWGLAFVAQKSGMAGLGPFGFVGLRFLLSTLVVLPLAFREWKNHTGLPAMTGKDWGLMGVLSLVFFAACYLQQAGMVSASVTNAGFLTALYVVFVVLSVVGWRAWNRLACGGASAPGEPAARPGVQR